MTMQNNKEKYATSLSESKLSSSSEHIIKNTTCDFGSVKCFTERVSWKWTMKDYRVWPKGKFEIKSPKLGTSSSLKWYMKLEKGDIGDLYMFICILTPEIKPTVGGTIKISIVSEKGNKHEVCSEISFNVNAVKKYPCLDLKSIFEKDESLKDTCTLVGEVSISSIVNEADTSEAAKLEYQSVFDSLGSVLWSQDYWDVELCSGDTKLKALRAVLAARSSVFAAMFGNDFSEARTGTVNIPDVDPDVLQQMLRHMYTGRMPDVMGLADRMLLAADKYDLPSLKAWCEEELSRGLSVDNATAMSMLALTVNCDFLKKAVFSFIKRNAFLVMDSDGWKNAAEKHPKKIKELIHMLADKTAS